MSNQPPVYSCYLASEADTLAVAGRLSLPARPASLLVFLEGDLGAGKTTFVRGYLLGLGWQRAVKSPTYTLVEPYELDDRTVCHFDLYRLGEPDELEFIGIRDYLSTADVCFVEWPGRGAGVLPEPDVVIRLASEGSGRRLEWQAVSAPGAAWVATMATGGQKL